MKIIFVDDESNIISGLKRMLFSLRKEWEMYFAIGAEEALKILEKQQIDIIVTDMRMPVIDGAKLLQIVADKYPHMIRIILSGHSDEEMAIRSTTVAHQFLAKPFNSDELIKVISKTYNLRSLFMDENVANLVNGIENLPSVPDLYLKLDEELKSPNTSLKNVGEIINCDIAMSAKILKLVNSAFFGLPANVTNPLQAVNLLGVNVVKSLVLFSKFFSLNVDYTSKAFSLEKLWSHSIGVANLAQKIFDEECNERDNERETYIAGLLHDVGKIILHVIPDYRQRISSLETDDSYEYRNEEQELLNTTHAEVGAYLLGVWNLPEKVIEVVAMHHNTMLLDRPGFSSAKCVMIANILEHNSEKYVEYLENYYDEDRITKWLELTNA